MKNVWRRMQTGCLLVLLLAMPAAGQSTWNVNNTGDWNVAGNWNGGGGPAPTSGVDTTIVFNLATATASNQNAANPYQLSVLQFDEVDDGGFALSGNQIEFTGAAFLTNNEAAGTVTVNNDLLFGVATTLGGAGTTDLAGILTGTGGIVLNGTGTVSLSNAANAFSGNIAVNNGILSVGADGHLGDVGNTLTLNSGTLNVSAGFANNHDIAVTAADGTIDVDAGQTLTQDADITGAAATLTKTGDGVLLLNVASGTTLETLDLNAGTVRLGVGDAMNNDVDLDIANGATFDLNGLDQQISTLDGAAGGTVNLGAGTLTVSDGTYAGDISATAGTLTKTGTGTLILSGTNSHTNGTNINDGTLSIADGASLGGAGNVVTFGGGKLRVTATTASDIQHALGADTTLETTGAAIYTVSGQVTGANMLTKDGTGTLTLSAGAGNTYAGGTTILDGTLSISQDNHLGDAAGGVTFDTNDTGVLQVTADGVTSNRTFTLDANGTVNVLNGGHTYTISGQVTGENDLVKTGDGILALSNAGNDFEGNVTISGGTLQIAGGDERIPDTAGLDMQGGTFNANGQTETVAYIEGAAGSTVDVDTGTVNFGDGTNHSYEGAVSSAAGGILNKDGTGWVWLNGDDSPAFSGTFNVNEGTAYLDATVGDGGTAALNVADGAALAGDGGFDGTVTVLSGGSLQPGLAAIGEFTALNYTPQGGSFLQIEVSSNTATPGTDHDHLQVDNNANLNGNGTVQPVLTEALGNYSAGMTWKILTATGAVNGEFAGVAGTGQAANFAWSLDYATDPNEVWLVLNSIAGSYINRAQTDNQYAVASALDRIGRGNPSGLMKNVFTQLNTLNDAQLTEALEEMSPARHTANAQVSHAATRAMSNALSQRFRNLHSERKLADEPDNPFAQMLRDGKGPDLAAVGDNRQALAASSQPIQEGQVHHNRWSFWFRVLGDLGDMERTNEQPGYRSNTVGVTFGGDYRIVRGLVVGMSLSYAKSHFSWRQSLGNGEIDSFYQMFYGSYTYEGFYVDGSIGWGYHWYQNDRKMPTLQAVAHSEHDACQFIGYLGTGYDFTYEKWTFGPTMWMQYSHLAEDGYTEENAGALNLRIDAMDTDSFITGLGGHVGTEVMWDWLRLRPDLRVEWLHEFESDPRTVSADFGEPGGKFRVTGPGVQEDAFRIGLHLDADWTDEVTTFMDYSLTQDCGDGLTSHTLWGGMKIRF